jgi:acyl carrier protein
VLRITGIGARDSFKDLGGKSIDLVRILVLLKNRLGVEIELPELFEHSTVTLLAKRLENGEQSSVALEIRDRAAKMRNARGRSTMRAANAESREPI